MNKFTFLADYKGGTYISQYSADNLKEALFLWGSNLALEYFKEKEKRKVLEQIEVGEFPPSPIDGIDNVWFDHYSIYGNSLFLNIVETV